MRPPGVLAHPFGGLHGPATHRRPGRGDAGDLAAAQPAVCVRLHRHAPPLRKWATGIAVRRGKKIAIVTPGAEDGRSAPCDDARPHLLLAAGITRTGGSTRLTRLTDHQSSPATGLSAANLWRIRKTGERESKPLASVENRAKE